MGSRDPLKIKYLNFQKNVNDKKSRRMEFDTLKKYYFY
jgi:hypothetical protein